MSKIGKAVDITWGLFAIFPVGCTVVCLLLLQCMTGCVPSGLSEVADKVPVQFTCGVNSDEDLQMLLGRYVANPETVTKELKSGFDDDPASTICLLIDGERYLQRVGKRGTEAYAAVIAALKDLKVL